MVGFITCRFNSLMPLILIVIALLSIVACASSPSQVPVVERSATVQARPGEHELPVHTVVAGETLSGIARRYGVSVRDLRRHNPVVDPDRLQPGDRLSIPAGGSSPSPSAVSEIALGWPLAKVDISSAYGSRGGKHRGVDIAASKGTRVVASADGVVIFAGRQNGYGRVVILQHKNNYTTLYAHHRKNKVKKGERVLRGQTIATVGKSGNASGAHLHFELRRDDRTLDPARYLSPRR